MQSGASDSLGLSLGQGFPFAVAPTTEHFDLYYRIHDKATAEDFKKDTIANLAQTANLCFAELGLTPDMRERLDQTIKDNATLRRENAKLYSDNRELILYRAEMEHKLSLVETDLNRYATDNQRLNAHIKHLTQLLENYNNSMIHAPGPMARPRAPSAPVIQTHGLHNPLPFANASTTPTSAAPIDHSRLFTYFSQNTPTSATPGVMPPVSMPSGTQHQHPAPHFSQTNQRWMGHPVPPPQLQQAVRHPPTNRSPTQVAPAFKTELIDLTLSDDERVRRVQEVQEESRKRRRIEQRAIARSLAPLQRVSNPGPARASVAPLQATPAPPFPTSFPVDLSTLRTKQPVTTNPPTALNARSLHPPVLPSPGVPKKEPEPETSPTAVPSPFSQIVGLGEGEVDGGEDAIELDENGKLPVEYCISYAFDDDSNNSDLVWCLMCRNRYERLKDQSCPAPTPFSRKDQDALVAHCEREHPKGWDALRNSES